MIQEISLYIFKRFSRNTGIGIIVYFSILPKIAAILFIFFFFFCYLYRVSLQKSITHEKGSISLLLSGIKIY